jgi:hypothetical protein
VGNGWKKESSETVTGLITGNGKTLPPAEGRKFSIRDTTEYVWFWHLVGQETKSYATGGAAPWHAPLTDLWSKGLQQRQEQFFIRLSSAVPLDTKLIQSMVSPVLSQLPLPDQI